MQAPNHPVIPDSFLWHPNCLQVPWCYFQNIFGLQPLLLLPAGRSHSHLLPGVLQCSPTLSSSLNPWSLGICFSTAAPVILMKMRVRLYHFCSAPSDDFHFQLRVKANVVCLPGPASSGLPQRTYALLPPSTPITPASLLFLRHTCQSLTSGPLHSYFICLHYCSR